MCILLFPVDISAAAAQITVASPDVQDLLLAWGLGELWEMKENYIDTVKFFMTIWVNPGCPLG